MTKPKFGYGWLVKWILAAILVGVGLTTFFKDEIVYFISGIFILIFSIFRVVPLLKTLKKEILRTIHLIEIILHTILAGLLLYVGIKALIDPAFVAAGAWPYVFKYSIVFILVSRGIVFFYSTTFLNEKVEQPKFWAHIAVLSLGSMIAVLKDFTPKWIATVLLVISLLGAAYLIYDGFMGYGGYRHFALALNKTAKPKAVKQKPAEKAVPETPQPEKEKEVPPPPQPEIVPEKPVHVPEKPEEPAEKIIN